MTCYFEDEKKNKTLLKLETCNPTRPGPTRHPTRPSDGHGSKISGSDRVRVQHWRVGSDAGLALTGRVGCGFDFKIYQNFIELNFEIYASALYLYYTRWAKSHFTEGKIKYLYYDSSERADFYINDRGMFKLYFYKDMSRDTFC